MSAATDRSPGEAHLPRGPRPQPLLARLTRDHDVEPNIRRANVDEHEGWIVCELAGRAAQIEAALAWLRDEGVGVDLLGDVVES